MDVPRSLFRAELGCVDFMPLLFSVFSNILIGQANETCSVSVADKRLGTTVRFLCVPLIALVH